MTSAVIEKAKPIASKASQTPGIIVSSITTKPPTRRQKFMRRMKKMSPMFLLGGIGVLAGVIRRRSQSAEGSK